MFHIEKEGMVRTMELERVKVKEAARELNMDQESLRYMMQAQKLPIGYAYCREGKKRWNYIIYRGMLDQYKKAVG